MTNSEQKPRRRRAAQIIAILVIVLLAAGLVATIIVGQNKNSTAKPAARSSAAAPQPANQAMVDPDRTLQVGGQVSATVTKVYSYDSAKLDQHDAQTSSLVSGAAKQQLDALLKTVRERKGQAATVNTTVNKFAVTALHADPITGDSATVLITMTEHVVSGGKKQDIPARMQVTAHENGVLWQIQDSDITFAHPEQRPDTSAVLPATHGRLSPLGTASQRDLILNASMDAAQSLSSVDYRDPHKSLDATAAVTTGDLHNQVVGSLAQNSGKIAKQQLIIDAKAVTSGLSALNLDEGTAEALVALNSTYTPVKGNATQRPVTVDLSMQRVNGKWLVANVQQL